MTAEVSVPKLVPVMVKVYFKTGEAEVGETDVTVGTPVVEYVKSELVVSELFPLYWTYNFTTYSAVSDASIAGKINWISVLDTDINSVTVAAPTVIVG